MTNHLKMKVDRRSRYDPKAPHFFKIMLHHTIQSGKLIIPKKFVRKYGTQLCQSNTVLLKVLNHDAWRVERRTSNDSVWLEKGWPDFLNFYSIKHGDFLVFRHKLGSCSNEFDVVIFDKSCTEIEYPVKSHVSLSEIKDEDISEDDDVPMETPDCPPSRRMTRRTTHLQNGSCSTAKDNGPTKVSSPCFDDHTGITSRGGTITHESGKKGKSPISSQEKIRGSLRGAEKAEALEKAKSFKSSRPHFPIVMQPHYLRPPYQLNMPGKFLQKYMGRERGEMKLHVSSGKIWTIRYRLGVRGIRVEAKVNGWKAFVVDNDLSLGDVCVFELIRAVRSASFNVTIFRAPKAQSSHRTPDRGSLKLQDEAAPTGLGGCSGTKSKGKEEESFLDMKRDGKTEYNQKIARGFEVQPSLYVPEHPFFRVTMTKSSISQGYLNIPAGFTREHLNSRGKTQSVTLKIGDRLWPTKLTISMPRAYFTSGFADFVKENSLDLEDMCTFELIRRKEMVFGVSIRRAEDEEQEQ